MADVLARGRTRCRAVVAWIEPWLDTLSAWHETGHAWGVVDWHVALLAADGTRWILEPWMIDTDVLTPTPEAPYRDMARLHDCFSDAYARCVDATTSVEGGQLDTWLTALDDVATVDGARQAWSRVVSDA